MKQWTQDEAVAYECAREAISHAVAIHSHQIFEESNKPQPDAGVIEGLRTECFRLFRERTELSVNDTAEVARIRAKYGALVRSWNAGRHARAAELATRTVA